MMINEVMRVAYVVQDELVPSKWWLLLMCAYLTRNIRYLEAELLSCKTEWYHRSAPQQEASGILLF
jgi:hypothetical protein